LALSSFDDDDDVTSVSSRLELLIAVGCKVVKGDKPMPNLSGRDAGREEIVKQRLLVSDIMSRSVCNNVLKLEVLIFERFC